MADEKWMRLKELRETDPDISKMCLLTAAAVGSTLLDLYAAKDPLFDDLYEQAELMALQLGPDSI